MNKYQIFKDYLINEGLILDVDETVNQLTCPKCNGGLHDDRVFSVTRVQNGYYFNCYRASCRFRGFYETETGSYGRKAKSEKRFTGKTYDWATVPLSPAQRSWFTNRYSLHEVEMDRLGIVYCPERDSYAYPIRDIRGYDIGIQDRSYPELGNNRRPKAISYWFNDVPKLYFPFTELFDRSVVIVVEDIISAIKGARYANTVAVLSSNLSESNALYLSRFFDKLVMALDRDAVHMGLEQAAEYNLLFKKGATTLVLDNDIKDLNDQELDVLLGGFNSEKRRTQEVSCSS